MLSLSLLLCRSQHLCNVQGTSFCQVWANKAIKKGQNSLLTNTIHCSASLVFVRLIHALFSWSIHMDVYILATCNARPFSSRGRFHLQKRTKKIQEDTTKCVSVRESVCHVLAAMEKDRANTGGLVALLASKTSPLLGHLIERFVPISSC